VGHTVSHVHSEITSPWLAGIGQVWTSGESHCKASDVRKRVRKVISEVK